MSILDFFKFAYFIGLIIFSIELCQGQNNVNKEKQLAQKGEIILNTYQIERGVALDGEWEFYWNQLLEPGDFYNNLLKPHYFPVPSAWNNYKINEENLPGQGYATYRLIIRAENSNELLALNIQNCFTSYKLWINGKFISQNGEVGTSEETTVAQYLPLVKGFYHEKDSIELVMQVANFRHQKGGIHKGVSIGRYEKVNRTRELEVGVDLLLFGCLMMMGLFFLGMFLFWKKDKSLIYFSLFCIAVSYRFISTGTYMIASIFPSYHWQIAAKLEYLSVFLSLIFMFLFLQKLFPKATSPLLYKILKVITIFVVTITIIFPANIFSLIIMPYQGVLLFYIVYAVYLFIKAYKLKYDGAIFAILSVTAILIAAATASLSHLGYIPTQPYIFAFGFLVFVFSQSFILAFRFAKSFHEVDNLREETLHQKTDIEQQNGVLVQQREEILQQQEEIMAISDAIHNKNDQIMSSIRYAKRIQAVVLPNSKNIASVFPNSFIFHQPRDIVSGDFPFFLQKNDDIYVAAVDCTGHGVPGAFISLIGYFVLNKIAGSDNYFTPGEILDEVNLEVNNMLRQNTGTTENRDGMDIALVRINLKGSFLEYAGAHRPLFFISNNGIQEIKGNRFPIGGLYKDRTDFTTHQLDFKPGDGFIIFSDGLPDQFGGSNDQKFLMKRVRKVFQDHQTQPMNNIGNALIKEFNDWKAGNKQTDDVLIMGVKF